MKVAIMTDSNSGITQEEAKLLGVFVLPMPVLLNDEEYYEGVNLTQEDFYNKLENSEVSTSQVSSYTIGEKWEEILKEYDQILHIPMSSALSSGCENAIRFASEEFSGKVEVVDNKRISVTQKQSVYDAINLAKSGKSAQEIKKYLEQDAENNSIYIMVDTLKYLKKGGRITPAVATIAGVLKIKPILQIQCGKLDKFSQVMTVVQGKRKMIEQITKELEGRFASSLKDGKIGVSIAYTNCKDKAFEFKHEAELALEKYGLKVDFVDPLPLSIACHIGSGALAITLSNKII